MDYIAIGGRFLIGTVFLVSAASKLIGPTAFGAFVRSLHRMRVLPPGLVRTVASVVVAAEISIVVLLAIPLRITGLLGFTLAAGLLVAFTAAIVLVLRRGLSEPCQCFGKTDVPMGPQHVWRNAFLLAVAGVGMATSPAAWTSGLGEVVVAAVTGAVIGGIITRLDDIIALFSPPTARQSPRHD